MTRPAVVKLAEVQLHLTKNGPSAFMPKEFGSVEERGGNLVLWDPQVPGLVGGVAEMSAESDHAGERHLDGDELLYVISGALRLALELPDGSSTDIALQAGEALLVPRGHWHRLVPDGRTRFMFFGGGRTEVRLRGASPA